MSAKWGTELAPDDLRTPQGRLAANLRRLRIKAGFTKQADLADKLGVAQVTISHWERGMRLPTLWQIRDLAEACECKVSDVVHDWLWSEDQRQWPADLETYRDAEYQWYCRALLANLPEGTKPSVSQYLRQVLVQGELDGAGKAKPHVKREALRLASVGAVGFDGEIRNLILGNIKRVQYLETDQ